MIRSNLCDYSHAYILVSGTVLIDEAGADDNAKRLDYRNKGVMFKTFVPFSNYLNNINNTKIDNGENINVVIAMYNLIKYSDNYLKSDGKFMAIL